MSLSDRRTLIGAGAAALVLGACGFQPMHAKDGDAAGLRGRVALAEAVDPVSFTYRERMRRRLGAPADAKWRLETKIEMSDTGIAETRASDITRHRVTGKARYALIALSDGARVAEGTIEADAGYDANAGVYATRRARQDAEKRVAIELAERVATRLLAGAGAIRRRQS